MELRWTRKALSDLARLYEFLAPVNRQAAARSVQSLVAAPGRLLRHPRIGEKLEEFEPREVRRLIVGKYDEALRDPGLHDLRAAPVAHARRPVTPPR